MLAVQQVLASLGPVALASAWGWARVGWAVGPPQALGAAQGDTTQPLGYAEALLGWAVWAPGWWAVVQGPLQSPQVLALPAGEFLASGVQRQVQLAGLVTGLAVAPALAEQAEQEEVTVTYMTQAPCWTSGCLALG